MTALSVLYAAPSWNAVVAFFVVLGCFWAALNVFLAYQQASALVRKHCPIIYAAGDYPVHVSRSGQRHAEVPVVILEAGTGLSSATWHFVQQKLSKFTQVISYDRPGLGFSPPSLSSADPATRLQCLRDLIVRLGLQHERVVMVGHSFGAHTALEYRAVYGGNGKHVVGMVLIEPCKDPYATVPGAMRAVTPSGLVENDGEEESSADDGSWNAWATGSLTVKCQAASDEFSYGLQCTGDGHRWKLKIVTTLVLLSWLWSPRHVLAVLGACRGWGHARCTAIAKLLPRLGKSQVLRNSFRRWLLREAEQLWHVFAAGVEAATVAFHAKLALCNASAMKKSVDGIPVSVVTCAECDDTISVCVCGSGDASDFHSPGSRKRPCACKRPVQGGKLTRPDKHKQQLCNVLGHHDHVMIPGLSPLSLLVDPTCASQLVTTLRSVIVLASRRVADVDDG
jgi:pimeloyl-ACP methyl ester carboxylesterase